MTWRPEYRAVLLAAGLLAAGLAVVHTVRVLFVLFAGVLFAIFLRAIAKTLARWTHAPYGAWLAGLLVLVVSAIVLSIVFVGPSLIDQLSGLVRELPRALQKAVDVIRRQPVGHALVPQGNLDLKPPPADFAASAARAIGSTVEVVGGLIVIFFVGAYGAAYPSHYVDAFVSIVPEADRARVKRALDDVDVVLTRWLIGRVAAMAFVGISSGIVFAVLDVPLGFALAVLAGLLTFVEYIGALASAVPPILLAFTKSPLTALWVAIAFTALHLIEGYVLTPLFARASARFPPAFTLAGQIFFAALVGPLGLTFSTPLLIVLVTAGQSWSRGDADAR